ncbi:MAG TPA: oxygenase MpaB family protein [Trebonia sp.]
MPPPVAARLDTLQRRLGEALFARVAGPEGPANRARFAAAGPRWFDADRPIRQVHGDAAMFVGGLRALLLQSLHPQAMIAVAQHSDYRNDPWGRLQRTSTFLAATTYGTADDAQRAVDRVRRVHQHITGTGPDGVPYRADDPHLLSWVHVAEADSFLRCHQRYGARPLDAAGCDGYVADIARIARALGVPDPPQTRQELAAALDAYRLELRAIPQAREAARFLVWNPPLPLLARGPYAMLAATAVAELPAWARRELRLPRPHPLESVLVPPVGHGIVNGVRWVMRGRR